MKCIFLYLAMKYLSQSKLGNFFIRLDLLSLLLLLLLLLLLFWWWRGRCYCWWNCLYLYVSCDNLLVMRQVNFSGYLYTQYIYIYIYIYIYNFFVSSAKSTEVAVMRSAFTKQWPMRNSRPYLLSLRLANVLKKSRVETRQTREKKKWRGPILIVLHLMSKW